MGGTCRWPSGNRRRRHRWRGETVVAMEVKRSEVLAPSPVSMPRAETMRPPGHIRPGPDRCQADGQGPPSPNRISRNARGRPEHVGDGSQAAAEIQAMTGDVAGALKTIRSIDAPNYQRFALERVVSARATAGDVAGALRVCLDESKTPEERRAALEGLGRGVDLALVAEVAHGAAPNDGRAAPWFWGHRR